MNGYELNELDRRSKLCRRVREEHLCKYNGDILASGEKEEILMDGRGRTSRKT